MEVFFNLVIFLSQCLNSCIICTSINVAGCYQLSSKIVLLLLAMNGEKLLKKSHIFKIFMPIVLPFSQVHIVCTSTSVQISVNQATTMWQSETCCMLDIPEDPFSCFCNFTFCLYRDQLSVYPSNYAFSSKSPVTAV